jgi:predicted lipoprotein with Yx(FWY)xxD motif
MEASMKKLALLVSVVAVAAVAAVITLPASGHDAHSSATAAKLAVHNGKLGRYLVDAKGRTLYLFEKDKNGKSSCSGACVHYWPPAVTSGKTTAGSGVVASKIGSAKRADGKRQITYAGHPLYRFSGDTSAGQTTGQGLDDFGAEWYVVAPSGKKIDKG